MSANGHVLCGVLTIASVFGGDLDLCLQHGFSYVLVVCGDSGEPFVRARANLMAVDSDAKVSPQGLQ